MFVSATIHLSFPKTQFKKFPFEFSEDLSLRYENGDEILYLGVVTDLDFQKKNEASLALEIRKDETPMWYLKAIIASAKDKEILLWKADKCIMRKGKIRSVEISDEAKDNDIVYAFFAKLFAGNEELT